jgi:hypothetical protein
MSNQVLDAHPRAPPGTARASPLSFIRRFSLVKSYWHCFEGPIARTNVITILRHVKTVCSELRIRGNMTASPSARAPVQSATARSPDQVNRFIYLLVYLRRFSLFLRKARHESIRDKLTQLFSLSPETSPNFVKGPGPNARFSPFCRILVDPAPQRHNITPKRICHSISD